MKGKLYSSFFHDLSYFVVLISDILPISPMIFQAPRKKELEAREAGDVTVVTATREMSSKINGDRQSLVLKQQLQKNETY